MYCIKNGPRIAAEYVCTKINIWLRWHNKSATSFKTAIYVQWLALFNLLLDNMFEPGLDNFVDIFQ